MEEDAELRMINAKKMAQLKRRVEIAYRSEAAGEVEQGDQ